MFERCKRETKVCMRGLHVVIDAFVIRNAHTYAFCASCVVLCGCTAVAHNSEKEEYVAESGFQQRGHRVFSPSCAMLCPHCVHAVALRIFGGVGGVCEAHRVLKLMLRCMWVFPLRASHIGFMFEAVCVRLFCRALHGMLDVSFQTDGGYFFDSDEEDAESMSDGGRVCG